MNKFLTSYNINVIIARDSFERRTDLYLKSLSPVGTAFNSTGFNHVYRIIKILSPIGTAFNSTGFVPVYRIIKILSPVGTALIFLGTEVHPTLIKYTNNPKSLDSVLRP